MQPVTLLWYLLSRLKALYLCSIFALLDIIFTSFSPFASCMYSVLKNVVMYIHVVSHYLGFYYKGAFPLGSQHALPGVHMQSVQDMLLLVY